MTTPRRESKDTASDALVMEAVKTAREFTMHQMKVAQEKTDDRNPSDLFAANLETVWASIEKIKPTPDVSVIFNFPEADDGERSTAPSGASGDGAARAAHPAPPNS